MHQKKDCPSRKNDLSAGDRPGVVKKPAKLRSGQDSEKASSGNGGEVGMSQPSDVKQQVESSSSNTTHVNRTVIEEEVTTQLLQEATGLLKSLRSMKSLKVVTAPDEIEVDRGSVDEDTRLVALLDGGATHPLRMAKPQELPYLQPITVELAYGHTTLYHYPGLSTILSKEEVEPIIPLRMLVDGGYRIHWTRTGCTIRFGRDRALQCWLRGGCPVMDRHDALELLDELERRSTPEPRVEGDEEWWQSTFPETPVETFSYMKRLADLSEAGERSPWNRRLRRRWEASKGVVIHLFAGQRAAEWRKSLVQGYEVITVELQEHPGQDLHSLGTWSYLWRLANLGLIRAIVGGPPCRSTSRLRHCPPGPKPLRGRGADRYGLPNLSAADGKLARSDLALMLKQLGLWWKACEMRRGRQPEVGLFVESPQDPMDYMSWEEAHELPSFWEFPELRQWEGIAGVQKCSFDQGSMGHPRRKPTSVLTNLPGMAELHGMSGDGFETMPDSLPERLQQTKTWAQWAPGLVGALELSLTHFLKLCDAAADSDADSGEPDLKAMSQWKDHIQRGHVPYSRNCRSCLLQMGVDAQHRRQKGAGTAYTLSVDLTGPFVLGEDLGTGKKAKYAMVATVPVPVFKQPPASDTEEVVVDGEVPTCASAPEHGAFELEEDEALAVVDDETVRSLNAKVKAEFIADSEVTLQNLTIVEPIADRSSKSIVDALGLIHTRFKAMGVPMTRLHSDRAKEFLSQGVRRWATSKELVQTMTAGDSPEKTDQAPPSSLDGYL